MPGGPAEGPPDVVGVPIGRPAGANEAPDPLVPCGTPAGLTAGTAGNQPCGIKLAATPLLPSGSLPETAKGTCGIPATAWVGLEALSAPEGISLTVPAGARDVAAGEDEGTVPLLAVDGMLGIAVGPRDWRVGAARGIAALLTLGSPQGARPGGAAA